MVVKVRVESGAVCVYKVWYDMEDGSRGPDSNESEEVSVDAPKDVCKASIPKVAKKIQAKTGDAMFQWEVLRAMKLDMSVEEMTRFTDPLFWLEYFPPLGRRDLKRFAA